MLFLMKTKLIWTPDHFLYEIFDYKLSGLFGRENCHYFRWLVDREKTSIYWDCACFILVLIWKPQARVFSIAWGPILLPLTFDAYLTIWWCGVSNDTFLIGELQVSGEIFNDFWYVVVNKAFLLQSVLID